MSDILHSLEGEVDAPFRVVVTTALGTAHQRGFATYGLAKEFMDGIKRRGATFGSWHAKPELITSVTLESAGGVVVRPSAAQVSLSSLGKRR